MKIEANTNQIAIQNSMRSAQTESVPDREPDGDSDDVKKAAAQPAKVLQTINPNGSELGTKINILA